MSVEISNHEIESVSISLTHSNNPIEFNAEAIPQEVSLTDTEQIDEHVFSPNSLDGQSNDGNETITDLDPPEGWFSPNSLAQELGCGRKAILKILEPYREEQLDWFQCFKAPVTNDSIEYLHPTAVELARKTVLESRPPEGWRTKKSISTELGVAHSTIGKFVRRLQEETPEFAGVVYVGSNGHPSEHLPPELVALVCRKYSERKVAPDGWTTNNILAEELGVDATTTRRIADPILEKQPELIKLFRNGSGNIISYYSPELVQIIREELATRSQAPEGWVSKRQLSKDLGCAETTLDRIVSDIVDIPEGWIKNFTVDSGHLAQHFGPELSRHVSETICSREDAPIGWMTIGRARKELGVMDKTVERLILDHIEEFENASAIFKDTIGKPRVHYSPELIQCVRDILAKQEVAPEGWMTCTRLADELGVGYDVVKHRAYLLKEDHDDWVKSYYGASKQLSEHYCPELIREVKQTIEKEQQQRELLEKEQANQLIIIGNLQEVMNEISDGETAGAKEFRELVGLFGAERAVDILYKFRDDYRKLPVEYVKSTLGEYLGDILVTKGGFSLAGLEKAMVFLSDTSFQESLTEVVKTDCLRAINALLMDGSNGVGLETVRSYLDEIRTKAADFMTDDLEQVLGEVEAYYDLLFQNIHKPEQFVDQLSHDRLFPDINQRINVQEIAFKRRMLISDEMGTGKTASVIMAKEMLGVKRAVVVVPGNVIEVWQDYLKDYFKEGQAPSVLTVDSPDCLSEENISEYDYILVSQERLNDAYTDQLLDVEFDMLIVDEIHKLKNITTGKRSQNLLRLAERIESDDNYLALLSGTPVPNKIGDVAIILKLLYPDEFKDIPSSKLVRSIIEGDALELRSLLLPRMQAKMLAETVKMPKLEEHLHMLTLSPEERLVYELLMDEDELTANDKIRSLSQFVMNPRMLDATPDIASTKITAVGEKLHEVFTRKNKVVMFVNRYIEDVMRGEEAILSALDLPQDVRVVTIDGDVPKEQRLAIQQQLRSDTGKMLLVVSGQTADVGVDFSAAEAVFMYNQPWTLYDEEQQKRRAYRPGLKDDLEYHVFVAGGTIEDGIRQYIKNKHTAIEKILRGIPVSEVEKSMLHRAERDEQPDLEFNSELARNYISSGRSMMDIYAYVKEIGEPKFTKFLDKHGPLYAESYANLVGARSYQANAGRLAGTLIDTAIEERKQDPAAVTILDVASGPEMLKRHVSDRLTDRVISIDRNGLHFSEPSTGTRVVGSFLELPIASESVDYANLSLSWHYTSFIPSQNNLERIRVLQELNRVLRPGGRAIVTMIHSLELRDYDQLESVAGTLGFKIITNNSGIATSGSNFRGQVISFEKVAAVTKETAQIAHELSKEQLNGIKFSKTGSGLKDVRKIVTSFQIGGLAIKTRLNHEDQLALEEETRLTEIINGIVHTYGSVAAIPKAVLYESGLSRIWNGQRYILFKKLEVGSGAVVIR